jgi:beta-glucosidase/6-phospho-beta-glucosidase/beta-galactosidase
MHASKFMFATGIENSYPTILLPNGKEKRIDGLETTGHYTHWKRDFELTKETGIEYLLANGMTRAEYRWFSQNGVQAQCVMGNDYYDTNEHLVKRDGTIEPSGDVLGYYVVTKQYYDRYRLPVMHTETNYKEPKSVEWLRRQWANAYRLKQDGVPLIGFTWYSLIDQVDWDTALREVNGRVNSLGLYDLNRNIRPVGKEYKRLITEWQDVLTAESYGMHISYS